MIWVEKVAEGWNNEMLTTHEEHIAQSQISECNEDESERRDGQRLAVDVPIYVEVAGGLQEARVRSVAWSGMHITTSRALDVNTEIHCRVPFENNERVIVFRVRWERWNENNSGEYAYGLQAVRNASHVENLCVMSVYVLYLRTLLEDAREQAA